MSDAIPTPPYLRLVGRNDVDERPSLQQLAAERRAEINIQNENRAAATHPEMQSSDPRWVLAARAYSQLQGSALTPERRQRVLRTAEQLGIRPFDANLIIAIVQDQARRGRGISDATTTLSMLGSSEHKERGDRSRDAKTAIAASTAWWQFVLTLAAGLTGTALLIRWLLNS